MRWAQKDGVNFGANFTQGLPHNWNKTAKAAPAKVEKKAPAKVEKKAKSPAKAVEEFSLLNDEET